MQKADFPNGLTVKQLKDLLAGWPDETESGEPTEVWIGSESGSSNQVRVIWPLNLSNGSADLLLAPEA
jgi:hypothetical protein